MRTIILSYPGFQSLPRGVKQLLLATENFYFEETGATATRIDATKSKQIKAASFAGTSEWTRPLAAFAGA